MTIPVVGIGASAGGLEAFSSLLARLPATAGLAFIFVQHLDPKRRSNLTEMLARVSAMPVRQAADGMQIEPDHLYVIQPDTELELAGTALRMTARPPASKGVHMPIDRFLRSLAQECGSRAIAVILSGAGTDGAAGLQAVKAVGGLTFAQDPGTAKFASMPEAAIESGCVDLVMSTDAIAEALTKLGRHTYVAQDESAGPLKLGAGLKDKFDPILKLLRDVTGINFALYRSNTVRRRILRRLALHDVESLEEYRRKIEDDPRELSALHRDLLINVTRFFRDPESFEYLKRIVYPRLVHNRESKSAVRIWVPGCATGEEVYSIAISLQEYFEQSGQVLPVQIFGSDVSSAAIEKARAGKYAATIAADVSPPRLKRYFSKVDGEYQIDKSLREMCVFSKQDLIQDPPFSKLDMISCRNVLIFFGSIRKNVVALFHYALKPGGFLVLGPSEAESSSLFSALESAPSIYTKNRTIGKQHPHYTQASGGLLGRDAYLEYGTPAGVMARNTGFEEELDSTLLARYKGAGVVVNPALEVLKVIGQTAPYLALPPGKVDLHLLKLIPETRLFLEVENLIREVEKSAKPARKSRVPYQGGELAGEINVEVIPLGTGRTRALLVLFEPVPLASAIEPVPDADPKDAEIAVLKQDLADAQRRLLAMVEEQRSAEKEGADVSEEMLSTNEELQSLNEELETAKEELQSTNEELTTVNEELRLKNEALKDAHNFAMLIVETAAAPLLVLDHELRIKTANRSFYRAFGMSAGETEGQLFYAIFDGCWDIPQLREMLLAVLPRPKAAYDFEMEHEFPNIGHRVLVLNARQLEGRQQILLGIDDVTERKEQIDAALHESEERFTYMADSAPVMIWLAGRDKGCTFFNKGWLDFTGRTMEQELGNGWAENVHSHDLDRCWEIYSSSFEARRSFQMEYRLRRADGEYRWLLDNGVPRFERDDTFVGYIGSCIDITDLKRSHEKTLSQQKLESVGTMAGGVAHDFNNLLGAILAHSELGLAELASGSRPDGELQNIRAASIRGAEIVRQLMIYAGEESEVSELIDVSKILEEMLDLLKVSVSKHVRLETSLAKSLPPVRANPGQLQQLAINLITNASEAIGDRDGAILITTERIVVDANSHFARSEDLAEGDYLQLEVSDTGCGMTLEAQSRVFDPFFTTKLAGHGLGLAVVQGVVRSLGGMIHLVSAPGKGTTFQILLPCVTPQTEAARGPASRAEEKLQTGEARLLVVEDELALRQAVSKMLRKKGFSVIEASDGSAALELIRAQDPIDVLILDITLPGASSREVLEEAKRLRPNMRAIVTSAHSREVAVTSLADRIDYFIRKPFRSTDLIDMIRSALSS